MSHTEHLYKEECYQLRCVGASERKCMKKCIYCGIPYMCDGIPVGDQDQRYAECGLTETHDPHTLVRIENK